MPRALVVCEFASLNGGERSLLAVLPHLRQAGWEFDFLAPVEGPLAEALRERGIDNVAIADWSRSAAGYHSDRPEQLAAALTSRHYDLAHANSLATSLLLASLSTRDLPTIGHLRDIVRLSGPKVESLNRHTRLLAVSAATRDYHVAQRLDPAKTHTLHNGVDLDLFHPSPLAGEGPGVRGLREELGLPADSKLIALIGQIILRKGQDVALAALALLLQSDPALHVVVIGERHSEKQETVEYERKLHAIAADAGVADRVHYLGTRNDMPQLMPQLSLLVHMARQEPLGRVLLEAAACGVPIVATDVGGTREIFPGEAGDGALLVPTDDVAAASAACRRILYDPALAQSLSIAGRMRIEAAFSVQTAAAGLLRHYNEIV